MAYCHIITFHRYFWCSRFCEFHSKEPALSCVVGLTLVILFSLQRTGRRWCFRTSKANSRTRTCQASAKNEDRAYERGGKTKTRSGKFSLPSLAIHVVHSGHAGEQGMLWDKTNKQLTLVNLVTCFLCLFSVHLLLSSMAVLYHLTN